MTPQEFDTRLLPTLAGLWPRMVARTRAGASSFDVTAAKEANRHIEEMLGEFDCDTAIDAARAQKRDCPSLPDKKGYDWLVGQIRNRLTERRTAAQDPARWTWQDECTLWHCLAGFARDVVLEKCGPEYGDELSVARQFVGKNPSIQEREWAYRALCKKVDEARARMISTTGRLTAEEAALMYPYPRDGYWRIRERWEQAAQTQSKVNEALALIGGTE